MSWYAKFLIIVILSVITQTSTTALDNCSEIKKANIDYEIENSKLKVEKSESEINISQLQLKISQLELKNSILKSANYNLSEQIEKFSAQNENCTVFADNIYVISESLTKIQEEVTPLSAYFLFNKTKNDPFEEFVRNAFAENQKMVTEGFNDVSKKILEGRKNLVESQKCLEELKTAKEDLTTAMIQAKNISTSLNTCLSELKTAQNPKQPQTCKEAADGRVGVFTIKIPNSNLPSFPVYCDKDNWMVILRRVDGKVDFQRGWTDYIEGFGDLTGNFIMGLEKIHKITKSQCHELKIDVEEFSNEKKYASYNKFGIDDENNGYALKTLGHYSGSAGDALLFHKGKKFSTLDKDNDLDFKSNLAFKYTGGWWYGSGFDSHLTGLYLSSSKNCKGITWNNCFSLRLAQMMIRPTSC